MTDFEDKVIGLLETINGKLDKLLGGSPEAAAAQPSPSEVTVAVRPSDIVDRQKLEEMGKVGGAETGGRRVCPSCGGTNFNTVEDKAHMISAMGGIKIYAKKYLCKKCGTTAPN